MNQINYSDITKFLNDNGVTLPYTIDKNMTYKQVLNLLKVVNNVEVENEYAKEYLIFFINDELDKKDKERKILEKNRNFARDVSLVTRKGNVPDVGPDVSRLIQEFGVQKTKGGKKSRRNKKSKKRKTKRRKY